jgi:hypothetical protein
MLIKECKDIELLKKMMHSLRVQTKRNAAKLIDPKCPNIDEVNKELAELGSDGMKIILRLEELGIEPNSY